MNQGHRASFSSSYSDALVRALLICLSCLIAPSAIAAPPALSDSDARQVVQRAIGNDHDVIPLGEIRVRNPMDPNQSLDLKARLYPAVTKTKLDKHRQLGTITIEEIQRGMEVLIRSYRVTATGKGLRYATKSDDPRVLSIVMGTGKVTRIVKNVEQHIASIPTDDLRLVLGVFEYSPSEIGKEGMKVCGQRSAKEYKFRAMMKADPFQNRYTLVGFQWGYIDQEDWNDSHC